MSERHIEMIWRCSTCQNRNLGRHMTCQGCGKPKDESEEYEMPGDTASAATVEDPALLRMARADEHWRCEYCGSHQRAYDGGCATCGAGRAEGANATRQQRRAVRVQALPGIAAPRADITPFWQTGYAKVLGVAFVVMCIGMCVVNKKVKPKEAELPERAALVGGPVVTDFDARVKEIGWNRSIKVERWEVVPLQGFTADLPPDAFNVKAAGVKFHHNEDVFDHDETVYDDVEVPDGFRTETYTDRESCGEDCTGSGRTCRRECTSRPQNCREVCTNKKNGFASCRNVCSGGGQDCHDVCTGTERRCTTRYCDRTKTRQIPKTRLEKRARIVKKYRQEPRTAPWSTYAEWQWVKAREEETSGAMSEPSWPDAGEIRDAGAFADGGLRASNERATMTERYWVRFDYEGTGAQTTAEYQPPNAEEFAKYTPGTPAKIHVDGYGVQVLSIGP